MVYRNGDDDQLPVEGSGMYLEVEGEDEKYGRSGDRTGQQEG